MQVRRDGPQALASMTASTIALALAGAASTQRPPPAASDLRKHETTAPRQNTIVYGSPAGELSHVIRGRDRAAVLGGVETVTQAAHLAGLPRSILFSVGRFKPCCARYSSPSRPC
jgi:hypothetical protein